jgi:cobalt/nickel transport system permease protein
MHMADALLSPTVGATMWAASMAVTAGCARHLRRRRDDRLVPLMGVLGAFVFTAQMINFAIPGTGSSGHLGGGLLLAILLGPAAAFLVITSVLAIQALFFMDGGLLALGCNIFNLGFLPAFVAYPLLYRPLAGHTCHGGRAALAAVLAAIIGLQLGALSVVLETTCSGISALPYRAMLLLMQPIHLAIGTVEGLATAALVGFLAQARPEALLTIPANTPATPFTRPLRPVLLGLLLAAALLGGLVSWLASVRPDGLEWSIAKLTGHEELPSPANRTHVQAAHLQQQTALLPDYNFPAAPPAPATATPPATATTPATPPPDAPASQTGTSVAGLLGGVLSLALAGLTGLVLQIRTRKKRC